MNRPQTRVPLLERWARFSHRRRGRVIGAWGLILVGMVVAQIAFGGKFISEFKNPGAESQQAQDLLKARFPARSGQDADLVFEARSGIANPETKATIDGLLKNVAAIPGVVEIESPYDSAANISKDGTIARAVVRWSTLAFDVKPSSFKALTQIVDNVDGADLRVEVGGEVALANQDQAFGSEGLGFLAAVFILLIAFGSVVAMGLPLSAAIFGLVTGFAVIALGANFWKLPSFSPQFAAMIGLGVGIDYSLLVVTRFREGLHTGKSVEDSVVLAVTTAGRSVIFAGIVVSVSFLGLFVVGLPFVAALGAAGAVVVLTSVLVAMTLMPALLSLSGRRIDKWRLPFLHSTEGVDTNSAWFRLSQQIQRRPLTYFLVSAVILLFLATPILRMELGFTDAGNLPEANRARQSYDLLVKGFGAGFNGPLFVVANLAAEPDPAARKGIIDSAVEKIRATADVVAVSPAVLNPTGDTALISLIPGTSPQSRETSRLVHRLRKESLPGAVSGTKAELLVTGATAGNVDAQDKITSRMPLLFGGVIGLSFILLMIVFRSVLVALKAAIMNLLSIGAAYGVIVAVFQWGWGADIIGVQTGPIETFLPMMMFAILFGLSMDYEVFLISRIREEYLQTGDNATAVSHGLAATARVITAAAAIMVAVFGSFVLGQDRVIKEFGIGLATAIFVDATVVRLILVPATMELLGDRNWWLPK
ncbi:MAG: MMPL family transporter, partial [Anaerolineaceae bacterium]